MSQILKNAIECAFCSVVVESTHVTHYARHACDGLLAAYPDDPNAHIAASGGKWKLDRTFNKESDFKDVSEFGLE